MLKIMIRGAGDLASGIAARLYEAGYWLLLTEIAVPTTVRRSVSFSRAVYEETAEVEGICAVHIHKADEIVKIQKEKKIPVIVDEAGSVREFYRPDVVVDAILAKKNMGTTICDASLVIGVGPGFTAMEDCHAVVETKRGHELGKVIRAGSAAPNTGIPGNIGGYTEERIIRARAEGDFEPLALIGDCVKKGQVIALSGGEPLYAQMDGVVRGMLQQGVHVVEGMKCGDVDGRCERSYCWTISDKARAVGGGVLEAVCAFEHGGKQGLEMGNKKS